MNNIPVAEVSIPTPGVNISRMPVAQNVTPLRLASEMHPIPESLTKRWAEEDAEGNSKHNHRSSARRTNRRKRASENRGVWRWQGYDYSRFPFTSLPRATTRRVTRSASSPAVVRRASPQVPLHPLDQMPPEPVVTPGCRPDSRNAACIGSGAAVGAAVGSIVPVLGTGVGACVGAACGLGAAVKRRFTGRGRKSRKKRGRKHKRKTRKHKKRHRRSKHKKKSKKRRRTKKR